MSGPENPVTDLVVCGPKLSEQLSSFLGDDFSVATLKRSLNASSMFVESRAVIQSFTPDPGVRSTQRAVFDTTRFSASCEPDREDGQETATFRVCENDNGEYGEHTDIKVSPRALKVLYQPVAGIIAQMSERPESIIRNQAVEIAYRGIYANVLTQYLVKQHVLEQGEHEVGFNEEVVKRLDEIYPQYFGDDGISNRAVQLNRLALAVGGATLMRLSVQRTANVIGVDDPLPTVSLPLKMYAAGRHEAGPTEDQQVSFSIANAMTPQQTAKFMNMWFYQEPPKRPDLSIVS